MKTASYLEGVRWIAFNDDSGSSDAEKVSVVAGYISTALLADLFGLGRRTVARDIVCERRLSREGELLSRSCWEGRTTLARAKAVARQRRQPA